MKIQMVDGHAHLTSRPDAARDFLNTLDALGFEKAIVVGGGTVSPEILSQQITIGGGMNVDVDNLALLAECQRSKGRLLPFYFANPHRSAEICRREGVGFFGLKLGPAIHGVALQSDSHLALLEIAVQFRHPVYLHCLARPGFEVTDLVASAQRFPKLSFILGHAGIGNCDFYAVSLIANQPNIYFETSGGFTSVVKSAFQRLGTSRLIFGSEYPLQDPFVEMEKARRLNLDPEANERFLRSNILRLLPNQEAA